MTTTQDMASLAEPAGEQVAVATPVAHEHGWWVESRHATSQGWVLYVRCSVCGSRRVDLVPEGGAVPRPCSAVVLDRSRG